MIPVVVKYVALGGNLRFYDFSSFYDLKDILVVILWGIALFKTLLGSDCEVKDDSDGAAKEKSCRCFVSFLAHLLINGIDQGIMLYAV